MTEDQRRKPNKAQQGEADGAETYLDIPPHLFQMEELLDRIRGHEIKLSKEGNYGNTDC